MSDAIGDYILWGRMAVAALRPEMHALRKLYLAIPPEDRGKVMSPAALLIGMAINEDKDPELPTAGGPG